MATHTEEGLLEQPETPSQIGGLALALTLLISLGLAIAVFFLGPLLITGLLHNQIGEGWLNLTIEGVIRLALLIGYLYLIGRIPDIQRVFGYHGAEHKAINAMEHGEPLDIPHVRQASRVQDCLARRFNDRPAKRHHDPRPIGHCFLQGLDLLANSK